jgi:hypothetical protein
VIALIALRHTLRHGRVLRSQDPAGVEQAGDIGRSVLADLNPTSTRPGGPASAPARSNPRSAAGQARTRETPR